MHLPFRICFLFSGILTIFCPTNTDAWRVGNAPFRNRLPTAPSLPSVSQGFRNLSTRLFGGYFASRGYEKLLQEQNRLLERKIRQCRDEMAVLRKQLQKSRRSNVLASTKVAAKDKQTHEQRKAEMKLLEQRIQTLESATKQLTDLKTKLEQDLVAKQAQVEALEAKLAAAQNENSNVEEKLARLRQELEAKAVRQLQELRKVLEQQMRDALAQQEAAAQQQLQRTVAQLEAQWQSEAASKVKDAQTKAEAAVEKEKVKMRKLVKALAERERSLLASSTSESATKTRIPSATIGSSSSGSTTTATKAPKAAGTVRSPFQ